MDEDTRIAIVAGEGALPGLLASHMGKERRPYGVFHLDGHVPRNVGQSRPFRLEGIAGLLDRLREEGYGAVLFAGRVARPRIDPARVEPASAAVVERLAAAMRRGDDGLLREVVAVFEEAGLAVIGPADVLPALVEMPEEGHPEPEGWADVERAQAVHDALAPLDIGQSVVVAGGQVLGVEALPGTDFLLATLARTAGGGARPAPPVPRPPQPTVPQGHTVPARSAARGRPITAREAAPGGAGLFGGMADWLSGGPQGQALPDFPRPEGGVLWKAPKEGQDLRVDMPVIGPDTVRAARRAGLHGIAVARDRVIVLDPEECVAQARGGGMFLVAVD